MPVEALRKQWDARGSGAPLHPLMTFEGDDLVLGAGTRLGLAEHGSHHGEGEASPANDARVVALLSAAYRRPIEPSALRHVHCALVKQSEGETTLALIHLALTGLPKLAHPKDDARRLFMADGLMKAGVGPRVILQALEIDDGLLDELERRYNPDQPRVPAGSGRESGQWADGSDAGSAPPDDSAGSPGNTENSRGQSGRAVQIADASSDWARFLNPIGTANFSPLRLPPKDAAFERANISCDDLFTSDKQICTSVLFEDDPHYHGQCMRGAMRRFDECNAGSPLSPLLPY